jgi:short-subunit dehydrogenase
MAMDDLKGKWALITGGSSGLGVEFARQLAARGANLVLAARRRAPMEELAASLTARHGSEVRIIAIDLARRGVGAELKSQLDGHGIAIDLLVNNAGYGLFGDFIEQPLDRTLDMLQLNVLSLTELTHVFAADMIRRGGGHILLVSSIGGFQATPTYAAYSASKAYVLLLGEALNVELGGKGVKVSVLAPGVTATEFFAVSGQKATFYQRLVMMRPARVVADGLTALFAGKPSVLPGLGNKLTVFASRFTPRILQARLAYLMMKN